MRRVVNFPLGLLMVALAGAPLHACAPFPAALSAQAPGRVLDARDGGDAAIALTLSLRGDRRLQSLIQAYGAADVNHLVVSVAKFDGTEFVALADSGGAPIALDLTGPQVLGSVALTGLRRNTTYQLQVKAYRNPGTAAEDLISLTDESSLAEVEIDTDEAPEPVALQVTLLNRKVTVAFPNVAGPLDVDAGTPDIQPETTMQSDVVVAYSEEAQCYLAAWRDGGLTPGKPSLYAQRLGTDGTAIGTPVQLSDGELAAGPPAIAYDPERESFLVVWASQALPADYAGDPGAYLLARAVSTSGVATSPFVVDAPAPGSTQTAPAVAYSALHDAFVVAWEDDRAYTEVPDVMAKRIDAVNLTPDAAAISVDAAGIGASRRSTPALIALSGDGRVAVAFTQIVLGVGTVRYGRLDPGSGALATFGDVDDLSLASDQRSPAFAHDAASGDTLLVWDDDRAIELAPERGRDLYMQRFNPSFSPDGSETPLLSVTEAVGDQLQPRVTFNAIAREYVLSWRDFSMPGGGDIFAGRRTSAGVAIGGKFAVTSGTAERMAPVLAHAGDAATNSTLLLWPQNGRIFHRVLDSRYVP